MCNFAKKSKTMTHDEEMWQDYDYHRNTGELPEYFDGDHVEYSGDGDHESCGGESGLDYIPILSKCPRCGSMSAKLLEDGTYSCLNCSANFYNGCLIKAVEEVEENEACVPLYCIKCGSSNTEYYENNTFHCLDCGCTTHPGASCPKCRRRFMELMPDNTWECLSCGAKFVDDKTLDDIQFKCHVFNIKHLADVNQEHLIKKYSRNHQLAPKMSLPKTRKK